ncbi:MAG: iron ABC transporter permease [Sporolactobacillus sp.]
MNKRPARDQWKRKKQYTAGLTAVPLLILSMLIVLPLLLIMLQSVEGPDGFHLNGLWPDTGQTNVGVLLAQTIWLGVAVSAVSLLLAFPLAFLSARTNIGSGRWTDVLLLIPFMTPPYISSMGWVEFMQKKGFLEQMLPAAATFTPDFFSFGGLVAIMSLQVFPIIYLILKDTLCGIGNHMDEAASVFGASFLYRLRRVYVPLLLPSCSVGLLLVFTKAISEFGTPATFGLTIGYHVMTTSVYQYVSSWPVDFGKAAAISFWLMVVCLLAWRTQVVISSHFTFSLIKTKEQYAACYQLRGWRQGLARLYISLVFLVSVGIPYFSIITTSLLNIRGNGLHWNNLTFAHYLAALTPHAAGLTALESSLAISLLVAVMTVILGFLVACLLVRAQNGWMRRAIGSVSMLPNTVPGIVLLLGMIFLWNSTWIPLHIYNTYSMVLLAYVLLFLPYAVQYAQSGITQIDHSLRDAGCLATGRRLYVLGRIILPIAGPQLLSAWGLIFVLSMRELVAALLILPAGMQNASSYIYAQFDQGNVPDGMALTVVSVLATIIVYALVAYWLRAVISSGKNHARRANKGVHD